MDAIKFLKEKNRMCNYYTETCCQCPLNDYCCNGSENEEIETIVSAVEKWSIDHPQKTILQDLLEKYPNAVLRKADGIPTFCPDKLGYKTDMHKCDFDYCIKCWNRVMEEE